jgi:hypothetical protein
MSQCQAVSAPPLSPRSSPCPTLRRTIKEGTHRRSCAEYEDKERGSVLASQYYSVSHLIFDAHSLQQNPLPQLPPMSKAGEWHYISIQYKIEAGEPGAPASWCNLFFVQSRWTDRSKVYRFGTATCLKRNPYLAPSSDEQTQTLGVLRGFGRQTGKRREDSDSTSTIFAVS